MCSRKNNCVRNITANQTSINTDQLYSFFFSKSQIKTTDSQNECINQNKLPAGVTNNVSKDLIYSNPTESLLY